MVFGPQDLVFILFNYIYLKKSCDNKQGVNVRPSQI